MKCSAKICYRAYRSTEIASIVTYYVTFEKKTVTVTKRKLKDKEASASHNIRYD